MSGYIKAFQDLDRLAQVRTVVTCILAITGFAIFVHEAGESTRLSSRHFIRVFDIKAENEFAARKELPAGTICPVGPKQVITNVSCSFVMHSNPGDAAPTTVHLPMTQRVQRVRAFDGFAQDLNCWDCNADQAVVSEGAYQSIFCLIYLPGLGLNNSEQVRVNLHQAGDDLTSPYSWKSLDALSFTMLSVDLERFMWGPPEARGRRPSVHNFYNIDVAQRFTRFWTDDDFNPMRPALGFSFGWASNYFKELEETPLYPVNNCLGVVGGICFLLSLLNLYFSPVIAHGLDRMGACKPRDAEPGAEDYHTLGAGTVSGQADRDRDAGAYEAPAQLATIHNDRA